MKNTKNNLDERQEQILLKIEHNSFWMAFWLLIAAMLIQEIVLIVCILPATEYSPLPGRFGTFTR